MTPNLYDLLDVDPSASPEQIRAAWKAAIADLDPTDRRFRVHNQAAEVLLDPERRAAYDAQLAAEERNSADDTAVDPVPEPDRSQAEEGRVPAPQVVTATSGPWAPPGWLLAGLATVTALVLLAAAFVGTRPSDTTVEDATREAQSAAERAIVPVLSYDYERLEEGREEAKDYMTEDYQEDYDALFELIADNAPGTETKVGVEVVASGIVRSGEDRVDILLFVNRPTTNKANREPIVYKDQVTVTMERVDGDWLVDQLVTSPVAE